MLYRCTVYICTYLCVGGLAVFSKLYPKLIDVCGESESPRPAVNCASPPSVTPGACEDVLAWQTAPPVRILSYLVIGELLMDTQ